MANLVKQKPAAHVLYLYGVGKTQGLLARRILGVDDGEAVEVVDCGKLACWISRVSRAEFADNLSRNMENLDWLAAMSIRHQRTVALIAEETDILPARFGTVFLNQASLRADIRSRKPTLEADFNRIKGSEEWGIKVFALGPQKTAKVPSSIGSGKDYLRAKSTLLRARSSKAMDEEIAQFAKELETIALATTEGGRISRGIRDLQFQASVLLKRVNRKKLESILRRFSKQWKGQRKIECSGPWPPYSFVSRSAD